MQVSPKSLRLQHFLKVPLLYMLLNAGLWSGIGAVTLKLVGELVQAKETGEHGFLLLCMCAFMAVSVPSITHSTNMAMKFYD